MGKAVNGIILASIFFCATTGMAADDMTSQNITTKQPDVLAKKSMRDTAVNLEISNPQLSKDQMLTFVVKTENIGLWQQMKYDNAASDGRDVGLYWRIEDPRRSICPYIAKKDREFLMIEKRGDNYHFALKLKPSFLKAIEESNCAITTAMKLPEEGTAIIEGIRPTPILRQAPPAP